MGQRMQAAGGCLAMALGWGAGLAVWSVGVRGRFWRFEQAPDWRVLYAELPLALLGGTAAGLALWAGSVRLGRRLRGSGGSRPRGSRLGSSRSGSPRIGGSRLRRSR